MLNAKPLIALAGAALLALGATAADLNPAHPDRYIVQRGDTLWDIAARFLNKPWEWPEIWQVNPQVDNPHLIYPGDELVMTYADGRPLLTRSGKRTVRLSPGVRRSPIDQAIPTIPIEHIAPFLTEPLVVDEGELEAAPYIVAFADEHIAGGTGQNVYARNLRPGLDHQVYRPGKPLLDSETKELLGHEAIFVGDARRVRDGDPATLTLTSTTREALVGDRLLPTPDAELRTNFMPHAPNHNVRGHIIRVLDGVNQIGSLRIVTIDRGGWDGLEPGHVLLVEQAGETIKDPVSPDPKDTVRLPDEPAGTVLIFRTFPRVSYGLVMSAIRAIHLDDIVRTPDR